MMSHKRAIMLLLALLLLATPDSLYAQDKWTRSEIVGLAQGTCIRQGPGFQYQAHTTVPEDDWKVMVIDGPRTADDKTWFDTSRNAAGDPSGGTGWVAADGSDRDCARQDEAMSEPSETASSEEKPTIETSTIFDWLQTWLRQATEWWSRQSTNVQWGTAFVTVVIVVALWRQISWVLSVALQLILSLVLATFLWAILDDSRTAWQPVWFDLAGDTAPDLAILVAMLPVAGWLVSTVRTLMRRRT